jgi:hypothetical protein
MFSEVYGMEAINKSSVLEWGIKLQEGWVWNEKCWKKLLSENAQTEENVECVCVCVWNLAGSADTCILTR